MVQRGGFASCPGPCFLAGEEPAASELQELLRKFDRFRRNLEEVRWGAAVVPAPARGSIQNSDFVILAKVSHGFREIHGFCGFFKGRRRQIHGFPKLSRKKIGAKNHKLEIVHVYTR